MNKLWNNAKQDWSDSFLADRMLFPNRIERYLLWVASYGGALFAIIAVVAASMITSVKAPLVLTAGACVLAALWSLAIWANKAARYIAQLARKNKEAVK